MRMISSFVLLVVLSGFSLAQTQSDNEYVMKTLYPATALLYAQETTGEMKMRCTATAIDKTDHGYVFVSAAHCGCQDDTDKEISKPEKTFFFITLDATGSKDFMSAKPEACGYRTEGDDFMLLRVITDAKIPVVALGSNPKILDNVVNVASPVGLGKQVFWGSVSSPVLDRPVVEGDINWTDAVLLQIAGVNGGSSGSSVICLNQRAICAFIVGSLANTNIVAIPVSRLMELRRDLAAGTYQYAPKKKKTAEKSF